VKFSYYDLGEQPERAVAEVRLTGSMANVLLLDAANFARYRADAPFVYVGGHQKRSPVHLEVPHAGRWFVVVDLGGFKGRVRGKVTVLAPDEIEAIEAEREAVEA
jgi:Domain of unknown function (DUF1883)